MRMQDGAGARTAPLAPDLEDRLTNAVARRLYAEAQGRPVRLIEALGLLIARQVRSVAGEETGEETLPASADPFLDLCRRVARRALKGLIVDPTSGATRYHREDELPDWSRGTTPVAEIGGFLFYRGP